MIDDLDLAWEEHHDRPRRGSRPTRQQRQRRRRERKRRRRSFSALLIMLIMLAGLGYGVYWGLGKVQDVLVAPDYSTVGTTPVTIEVKSGDTATAIGQTLYDKHVVKSVKAFVNAAKAEPRSQSIQVGFYQMFVQMPAAQALAFLLDPANHMVVNKVTIPEGMITVDIYTRLAKATGLPLADFVQAAKDPEALGVPAFWFNRDDGKTAAKSIEGFLFPDTYSFPPGATAQEMLHQMVVRFLDVATELKFVDTVQTTLHISPHEALVAASIAQVEAVAPADMAKVARVLYNRAYGTTFPCRCLGLDSEVNYWLRIQGKPAVASEHLTSAQLHDAHDPYNTHDKPGLPYGAISNPGKDALQGAMAPTVGKWIYFLSIDKQGHMAFALDEAGFLKAKQQACANGIPIC
jgi:peptidoglycan lytic transglycosylase G